MLYIILSNDVANSLPLRKQARGAHIERIEQLKNEGRLIAAGPLPAVDSDQMPEEGFTGSLIIAEFDSLEDARKWADSDPYMAAGVYANSDVRPFKLVLP